MPLTNRPSALSRRQFVVRLGGGAAVSAVGVFIAACQPAPSASPTSAPAPTVQQPTLAPAAATSAPAAATAAPAAGAPKRGGTLVMAQASDPNPVPGNNDGSQDGQDFSAADVAFTYREITPKYVPTASATFKTILQKVETPDPSTVKLTLNKEYGPFLAFLNVPIVPEHVYTGTDYSANPANRAPVGTGPFRVTSWTPGDSIVFERSENYWKPGQPYLDGIVLKIIPQAASRISALKAGEIDYLPYTEVVPQDFASIKDDPSIQWATGLTSQAQVYLTLNLDHEPFDNKQFRQALMTALDRETMAQQITLGVDSAAISAFHNSITWAQNPNVNLLKQYAFDPSKANQMLDAAGFPRAADGNRTRPLRMYVEIGRPNFDAISQFVTQQWKTVGIPVTIMPLDRTVMQDMVFVKRDFDVNLNESNTSGDPEIGLARFYTCNSIQPIPSTNGAGYCNPDVDKLFAAGAEPSDPSQRGPSYAQIVKILADDMPYLSLIDRQDHSVASAKFELKSTFWNTGLIYDQMSGVYLK